jgi:adenylate kinase family enzyme
MMEIISRKVQPTTCTEPETSIGSEVKEAFCLPNGLVRSMDRIAVVGAIGVGKSVLAQRLGLLLGLPVYDFDAIYWRRDRERLPEAEWESLLRKILGQGRWILDGFPLSVTREPIEHANTVLFLDLPRRTSTVSVIRRRLTRMSYRRHGTSAESRRMFNALLFRWIWAYPKDYRPELLAALSTTRAQHVLVFRSRRQVRRFLASVEREIADGQGLAVPEG